MIQRIFGGIRRPTLTIILLLLVAECAVVGVTHFLIEREWYDAVSDGQRHARDRVVVLRASVKRVIDQVSALQALGSVVSHADRVGASSVLRHAQEELSHWRNVTLGGVAQVALIGADGYMIWSNIGDVATPVYLGDREHFRAIVERRSSLYISGPLLRRVSKRYTVQFSRGVYDPDGALTGVIVVSLDPAALIPDGFDSAQGQGDAVSVFRRDGTVLARLPPLPQTVMADVNSKRFKSMIAAETTLVGGPSLVDKRQRWAATASIPETDLFVTVGVDVEGNIVKTQPTVRAIQMGGVVIGLLLIGLAAGWNILSDLREQATAAQLRARMLTDADSLFRKVAEGLPDAVHLTNSAFDIIFTNPAGTEPLGAKGDEIIPTMSTGIIHSVAELVVSAAQELRNAPAGTKAARLQSVLAPDGAKKWYDIRVQILNEPNNDPSVPIVVTSARDVTKLVEADSSLRAAQHDMMTILLATRSIIFRYDLSDNSVPVMRFVSDSALEVTGYQPSEIVNQVNWMSSKVHPDNESDLREHYTRLRDAGRSSIKYRLKHKDDHWVWMQSSVERQTIDGKTVFLGHMRDVSSEHLLDMQVAQSAKLAMLGEMTTGMAHELNQPLATISMAAENAMAMLDDTQVATSGLRQKLERIVAQVGRAAQVIDHMRVFGRMRGQGHASLYISEQIDGVLDILTNKVRHESIVVTRTGDIGGIVVRGDAVAFQQVLMNLIGNAIDAVTQASTPLIDERRTIRIDIGMVSGQVRVAITDRAGGVSEEIRAHMFEPFFTTKPTGLGTGLGLSISYGIIKEMGGVIAATNVQDGLEVEILLPVATS